QFGASVAMVDEWQAIGGETLAPWHDGTLTFAALFQAHNGDHPIVATRLAEILCYTVNGSWDPELMMTFKAGVYAVAATVFIHLFCGALRVRRYLAAGVLTALFVFPFSYQNLLWAFQSQFDFFLLTVALGWLALLSGRTKTALTISFLSLFTLGAGPILAGSYLPLLTWNLVRQRRQRLAPALAVFFALLVFAVGFALRANPVTRSTNPRGQFQTLTAALAWPYSSLLSKVATPRGLQFMPHALQDFPTPQNSWFRRAAGQIASHPSWIAAFEALVAGLMLFPILALIAWVIRHRTVPRSAIGPLSISGFALMMTLATAITRAGQQTIAVRYLDLVALTGFAAIAAAFVLLQLRPHSRRWLLLWGMLVVPGYLAVMGGTVTKLNTQMPAYWLKNLQVYFTRHDHSILANNRESRWPILEDASVPEFMKFLDDPQIAPILPRSVTQPDAPSSWTSAVAREMRQWSAPIAVGAALLMFYIGLGMGHPRKRPLDCSPGQLKRALPALFGT
ncbi:MAG: putative transrane protein, partial [Lacunisphaera sp.]|nr:putative transrane protein [Lacunisphaera sp.]